MINRKIIEPKDSHTGNRIFIYGCKSLENLEKFPENKGIVRASTYITGYYIEELSNEKCNVHFIVETDYKIPLWIQQHFAPNAANYAWILKNYAEKRK